MTTEEVSQKKVVRKFRYVAIVVAALIALAGCGGSDTKLVSVPTTPDMASQYVGSYSEIRQPADPDPSHHYNVTYIVTYSNGVLNISCSVPQQYGVSVWFDCPADQSQFSTQETSSGALRLTQSRLGYRVRFTFHRSGTDLVGTKTVTINGEDTTYPATWYRQP